MILTFLIATALADPLPPPNFPHGGQSEHSEVQPAFGADVSIGYAQGFMTSPWIEKGGYGVILGRYEAFAQDRNSAGPRIGASVAGFAASRGRQASGRRQCDAAVNRHLGGR